jgi:hypothetical protein
MYLVVNMCIESSFSQEVDSTVERLVYIFIRCRLWIFILGLGEGLAPSRDVIVVAISIRLFLHSFSFVALVILHYSVSAVYESASTSFRGLTSKTIFLNAPCPQHSEVSR